MKQKSVGFLLTVIALGLFNSSCEKGEKGWDEADLRKQAAQMLVVGFQGTELSASNPVYGDIATLGVGGVVLSDTLLSGNGESGNRNILSPVQLKKLIADLKGIASTPLLVCISQEGGTINPLQPAYGFPSTVSARYLGNINNADTTHSQAGIIAGSLSAMGINVNLAPCIDLNTNPSGSPIGIAERSFSAHSPVVTEHAGIWIDEHHHKKILTALKHFPGYGSAGKETFNGLPDISETWESSELAPYRSLIQQEKADLIWVSHLFNRKLDAQYPATLSAQILNTVLRNELKFKGVIIIDDVYNDAIIEHYTLETAVLLAINAGADMFLLGNNSRNGFFPERPGEMVEVIVKLVKDGKISSQRIEEAYYRIQKLKLKLSR